jgi:NADH:ubiquinone oxidoreductase subunit C
MKGELTHDTLKNMLTKALGKNLFEFETRRRNRVFVKVKNGFHRDVVEMFKEMHAHLSVISSVDLGEELELVYHFEIKPLEVGLKTAASKVNPKIETISDIYPSAAWYEREAMEMMGFTIVNHPDPRHLFLPDDYTEFPLRRY